MVAASTVAACETYTGYSHFQFQSFGAYPNPIEAWIPEAMQSSRLH
jgi:hypothetical protein